MTLSKSLYTRGLQCQKSLWLKINNPSVLTESDDFTKNLLQSGTEVGELSLTLFPDGVKIPFDGTNFEEKIEITKTHLKNGVNTLFEATFQHDDVIVITDILNKQADGSFEMYEVKSSSHNDMKPINEIEKYIQDASIQFHVLSELGHRISKIFITMIDTTYTFQNTLEIDKLFTHIDVTEQVLSLQTSITPNLKVFQSTIIQKEEPNISIGQHCCKPYKCDAYNHCWREQNKIPEFSVFNVFTMGRKSLELFENGAIEIEDIPDESVTTPIQRLIIDAWNNKEIIVDKEAISSFVKGVQYPIYHLDFETFMSAVPSFNNQTPYQQICFQYSVHIENEDGTLEHKEFLAKDGCDPRESFIISLLDNIPLTSTILVYSEIFEKTRIKELARDFPLYCDQLTALLDNVIDLALPFRKKHYYHYQLKGKYSIKLVMPLLVPEMADAYKNLQFVKNGGDAMNTFPKLSSMDAFEKKLHRDALLEYCKLDTLSMVKVFGKLKELVA